MLESTFMQIRRSFDTIYAVAYVSRSFTKLLRALKWSLAEEVLITPDMYDDFAW